ncbi:hypothetical protein RRG08_059287 [Elysia crispata]|uniref:Uncharacterized protein n=1 Tax=Elysia crispata TaxID=231223 RepID=A0AAE1DD94_9GAST|nr:hypothetical protein RRG08_059287 [Elysia crispata]
MAVGYWRRRDDKIDGFGLRLVMVETESRERCGDMQRLLAPTAAWVHSGIMTRDATLASKASSANGGLGAQWDYDQGCNISIKGF